MKAAVSKESMHYFRLTEGTLKLRYANHQTSFRHERYSNATELSKDVWDLKARRTEFEICCFIR